ncbi:MAG: carbohydrate porin, partial [Candidatus Omnitrophica bacterium]|nr:carbohydrate porin [Candidatus Omnitrophota bacterium]
GPFLLTLYSNVNYDVNNENNVSLTELWYEQTFWEDRLIVNFGKLDSTAYFDNNEVANDETTQFLARIFRNSPVIEFPDNTLGIRISYLPKEWLEFAYGFFEGDSDWEKIGDRVFNIAQITFKTNFSELAGNWRFLGWHSNSNHIKWLDLTKEKEDSYGFGLSFDQMVNDAVTIFLRYGWQEEKFYNPEITAVPDLNYSLEHSYSLGFHIKGNLWGRDKDVLGFAFGQIFASDDYKKVNEIKAKPETHIESYYRINVNEHLSFSPDFQYILNPFGKDIIDDTKSIFIGGLRVQMDY